MNFNKKANLVLDEIQKVAAMYSKEDVTDDIVLYALYRINQHESLGKVMYASSMSIFMLRRALDYEYDMEGKDYGKQEIKNLPFAEQTECLFKDAESYAKHKEKIWKKCDFKRYEFRRGSNDHREKPADWRA